LCSAGGIKEMLAAAEINYIRHEFNNKDYKYSDVKNILPNGERQLTEEFQNFVLHYGFECEFCNPNSGNKKGHVEVMVKYVRNNFLLPGLHVINLDDLNKELWAKAEKDRERKHYQKEWAILSTTD
jgi:transposase